MKKTLWLIVAGALLGSILVGRASDTLLNGLFYTWPTSHAAKALANNGSGTLTWTGDIDSGVPAGLIGFYASGSCPTGWAEYTAARNRYIVNRTGHIGWEVGVALGYDENRVAGNHGHSTSISASISDSSHSHGDSASNHDHGDILGYRASTGISDDGGAWTGANSNTSGTGISLQNANANISASPNLSITGVSGGVAGTNAPYIRMLVCQKQ